jgi:lipoprotein-releasing system permease protein
MSKTFESFIGLRYVRAKRRNNFISFISLSSILGVALGVMAIITVLSVWNGFEEELRDRTLGMVSHATIYADTNVMSNWQQLASQIAAYPEITGVAPYFREEGMVVFNEKIESVIVQGVLPESESLVSSINETMIEGDIVALEPGSFGIILGVSLAATLDIKIGEKLMLVAPQANITPVGILPRMKRFEVIGLFSVGINEYDSAYAMINLEDAERFYRAQTPGGLRIKTDNVMDSPYIIRNVLQDFSYPFGIVDWTQENSNFFRSLALQKVVMFIILMLIVAVAAFNIVSTLIMVVVDKQADIAVLRTMGASQRNIMKIFITQGIVIGLFGVLLGDLLGTWLSTNIADMVSMIENAFSMELLPCDVYYICEFPSSIRFSDVILTSIIAFMICALATIYPAYRASKTHPAEALRYD